MNKNSQFRKDLSQLVRREIHGPNVTDPSALRAQIISDPPQQYYSCGILYPVSTELQLQTDEVTIDGVARDETVSEEYNSDNAVDQFRKQRGRGVQQTEDDGFEDLDLTNQLKPSAISISFVVSNASNLNISLFFATYLRVLSEDENGSGRTGYKRQQHRKLWKYLIKDEELQSDEINVLRISDVNILNAKLLVRKIGNARFSVTVSLINRVSVSSTARLSYNEMVFQPQITVKTPNGNFEPFVSDISTKDPELDNLSLQYRNVRSYCRGHGCAGEWSLDRDGVGARRVLSNLMPQYEVPGTLPRTEAFKGDRKLNFFFKQYSKIDQPLNLSRQEITEALTAFLEDYKCWYENQIYVVSELGSKHEKAIKRISDGIEHSLSRMKRGIDFLLANDNALKAFIITNRAMWMQQCHVKLKPRFTETDFSNPSIDLDTRNDQNQQERAWRPFQLAFVLMNLYSIPTSADIAPDDGNIVDLIWFPTGGGKTEAYLGLAAFSIVYSRLVKYQHLPSTSVIMRYTLRLLTGQQFNRASTLICALEYLRRYESAFSWDVENFQRSPTISIGLWVGKSLTPNTNKDALSSLQKMRKKPDEAKNVFQIFNCPWCKGDLCYRSEKDKAENIKSYDGYDVLPRSKEVIFVCRDTACPMDQLPIYVVDEQLYSSPPSLLIGTVDKFAQLSWKNETGNFFGIQSSAEPPNLIIQDELHLISGPLGSIVAHYEYLIRAICEKSGFKPKVIASTATIRSAEDQVKNLFRSNVCIFPAPGFSYDDNYFSYQTGEPGSGRLYVGVFASATPSVVTAERNLAATLLQMPRLAFNDSENFEEVESSSDDDRKWWKPVKELYSPVVDPYGTLVWYFNSIRELGYAKTLLVQDIAEHFKVLQRRYRILPPLTGIKGAIEELTSRADEEEIGLIESALNRKWLPLPTGVKSNLPIDALLATNMISVGFDVGRLGLMLINGQPKNTAEYIQASSRVGRSQEGPGLVYCLYNHSRSRDRSHFENFFSYHQALYRNVEPTSITPLAPKARMRALPGLIVGIARHIIGINEPSDLDEELQNKIIDTLKEYIEDANYYSKDLGSDSVVLEINRLLEIWKYRIESSDGLDLTWGEMGSNPQDTDILAPFGTASDDQQPLKLELLMSMRNVDGESRGEITLGSGI